MFVTVCDIQIQRIRSEFVNVCDIQIRRIRVCLFL